MTNRNKTATRPATLVQERIALLKTGLRACGGRAEFARLLRDHGFRGTKETVGVSATSLRHWMLPPSHEESTSPTDRQLDQFRRIVPQIIENATASQ